MRVKILKTIFFSICLLLTSGANCLAQDEAAYQNALAEANKKKNPSEYRAQVLKKYLDASTDFKNSEGYRMGESQLHQFVANKLKEMMAIDFYAAFLTQSITTADFIKWHEVFELVPSEQIAAINKLNQWETAGGSKSAYPSDIPQPGHGWKKPVSGNASPKEARAAAATRASANTPSKPSPDASSAISADDARQLGNELLNKGDYDGAIRSYSECVRLDQNAEDCYMNRARAHAKKENYKAAIADYTQSIKFNPNNEGAFIDRGIAYTKIEEIEAGIADFEAALKINPNNEKVKGVLDAARNLQAGKKKFITDDAQRTAQSEDYFKQGNQLFGQQKYEEAIAFFTKCIEAQPLNFNCWNARGMSYGIRNNFDKAIEDFSVILLINQLPVVYYRRGLAFRLKGDFDAAIKDFTKAVELAPDDFASYAERGIAYFSKGNTEAAIKDYTEAIKRQPQEAKYYFLRGLVYRAMLNNNAAIADFKKSLEINPNFSPAKNELQIMGVQP